MTKKIDVYTVARVMDALLRSGAYDDADLILREATEGPERYRSSALVALLTVTSAEREKFPSRQAFIPIVRARLVAKYGEARAESVIASCTTSAVLRRSST